jgi:hypothetical protein
VPRAVGIDNRSAALRTSHCSRRSGRDTVHLVGLLARAPPSGGGCETHSRAKTAPTAKRSMAASVYQDETKDVPGSSVVLHNQNTI